MLRTTTVVRRTANVRRRTSHIYKIPVQCAEQPLDAENKVTTTFMVHRRDS